VSPVVVVSVLTMAAAVFGAASTTASGAAGAAEPLVYLVVAFAALRVSPRAALLVALAGTGAEAVAAWPLSPSSAARVGFHALVGVGFAIALPALVRLEGRRGTPAGRLAGRPAAEASPAEHHAEADLVLRRILAEVLTAQGADGAVFLAEDPDSGRIAVRCALPDDAPVDLAGRYGRDEEAVFRWLWERRRLLSIPEIVPGFRRIPFLLPGTPVQAFLGVPVLRGAEVLGAVCVFSRTVGAFGHEQERLLDFAAREIAESVGQARRLVVTSRQAREFERLFLAMQRLTTTLDLGPLLEQILEAAETIVPYDRAAVLLGEGDGTAVSVAATGPAGASRRPAAPRKPAKVAGTRLEAVLADRTAMALEHARDRRGGPPLLPRGLGVKPLESTVLVPLCDGDRRVGALVLTADRRAAFPPDVLRLLEILANQAAVVIAHAHAYRHRDLLAHTDPLTGLVNRRRFDERLAEEFARARRDPGAFSLVLADLDHFKRINDTYGHPAGDRVLRQFARRIEARARASDVVGRLGGEEFGLLLVRAGRAGALAVAERVRQDVRETPFEVSDGVTLALTLSLGVATCPDDADGAAALFARADAALYEAKRGGRDRVCAAAGAVDAVDRSLEAPVRAADPAGLSG
jgi:diguanylate cyclase (GGDEF)-like protein